jgi:hypothetical protein
VRRGESGFSIEEIAMNMRCLFLALVSAVFLCAHCGDGKKESRAGLGEPCVEVECLEGLVCYQDVCRSACGPSLTCPSGDERCQDGACVPVSDACGNGRVDPPLENCDGDCPSSCDDADACTSDVMTGSAATCNVRCSRTPVTACAGGDGCCPEGCDAARDDDCEAACPWSSCTSVLADYNLRHNYVATDLPDGEWDFGTPGLADIDGDGDLDFLVGVSGGAIHWFEYEGRRTDWTRHTVGPLEAQQLGSTVLDVDGDGRVDLVVGGAWYRNPPDPRTEQFTRFVYETDVDVTTVHDIVAADVDGDGGKDVVRFSSDHDLVWLKIPPDPTQLWTRTVIADESVGAGIHGGLAPMGAGDLDGDGDTDLVLCRYWFRNDGGGAAWTRLDLPFGRNGTYGDGSPYGVDTGVYFRTNEEGAGYQLCIDYQPDNPMGEIYGEGIGDWDKWSSAWDYTIADESTIAGSPSWFDLEDWSTIWHPGGWNAFRMRVEGNPLRLQVWINGTKTYEYTDPETLAWTTGTIRLQVHDGVEEWPDGAVARFRNLRVSTVVGE